MASFFGDSLESNFGRAASDPGELPLSGLRVLDFTRVLSGPLCTQLLGELGADVIKVESTDCGDETRGWPPFYPEGTGSVFLSVNRNKRSLALDLKTEEGREIIHALAADCDVAIENFSVGVADRLGIDYAALARVNKRIIYCSVSGFGRSGPLSGASGYDVILQAFSGMMSLTGEPDGSPTRIPISPIDQVTGINALAAILLAVIRRQRTGEGSEIHISLLETAISLLNHPLQSYWQTGKQPRKCGSRHESLCPYEAFEAADGMLMLGVANDSIWRRFCAATELDHLASDVRFVTNASRVENRSDLLTILRPTLKARPVDEWFEKLSSVRVPVSPVNDLDQMLAHPQTVAVDVVLDYILGSGERVKGVGSAFTLDRQPRRVASPPPRRGEHSRDILAELGLEQQRIEDLVTRGIVAN